MTRALLFWGFVLLTLPACGLGPIEGGAAEPVPPAPTTPDPGENFIAGSFPRSSVVFCDIERVEGRRCATFEDLRAGVSLFEAALALNTGETSNIGLDYSPEAIERCRQRTGIPGIPEAVRFHGSFPDGLPVCLNCADVFGAVPKPYIDLHAACRSKCYDMFLAPFGTDGTLRPIKPPTQEASDFCASKARASTGQSRNICMADACATAGGGLLPGFLDPRRTPEAVIWTDLIGVEPGGPAGNDLRRTAATSGQFDAGALSSQFIQRGDAWVEFSARAGQSQIVGLAQLRLGDPSDESIDFGILLRYDGAVFVSEGGALRAGPGLDGSFVLSVEGDRLRVYVRDNGDGTASVEYWRLIAPCLPGSACNATKFYTASTAARYPLRVDTSLFHEGATLTDVRVMRIF